MNEVRDVIIIGGGPAGYTAALYAARANLQPLVIEGFNWGGQLMITSDVENYPGYSEGMLGPEMMQEFRAQADRFGAEFLTDDVTRVDFSEQPPGCTSATTSTSRDTVIVATGATARQLGLDSELELQGRGVSYCATCDAASSATRSSLSSAAGTRRWRRRASSPVRQQGLPRPPARGVPSVADHGRPGEGERQDRARLSAVVEEVLGDGKVTGVRIRNLDTDEISELETDGFFVAIGHDPSTALFVDQLDHDENGYLVTRGKTTETNVPGVFAAGDVQDHIYRQAVTAAGSGTMAALDAERYLASAEGHLASALTAPREHTAPA